LSLDLKDDILGLSLKDDGSMFQSSGAATEKERRPYDLRL
jgi:hypothetical protein